MADQSIGTLPTIETLADDASFVAEQQGKAGRVTGAQIKGFAKDGVNQYVEAAQEAAQKALEASEKAMEAVAAVEGAADEAAEAKAAAQAAAAAQEAAEAAQAAAEAARDQAQAIAGGDFLPIAGGTLTGPLILSGAPTEDNGAANKKYVDDAVGSGTLMKKETYDPTGAVASAGGIVEYVEANAGANMFLTTFSYVNNAWTADQTYAEIYAAHESGKVCVAKYGSHILVLRYVSSSYVLFASAPSDTYVVYTFKITSADAITYAGDTYLRQAALSSSISSTSTTTPANSNAVKSAYDKANSAYTLASEKPSVTTGSVSLSKYASYPEPTASGEWVRIGNVVQVDLYINPGSIKGLGFTNLIFNISGLPAQKYGNGVNFLTHVGISICTCQIDLNAGVMNVKNIEASEISGTFDVKFSYIAA